MLRGECAMADISKMMRSKRFSIKDQEKITLKIETYTGSRYDLRPTNCSITGIGAILNGTVATEEGLEVGQIIPAAKLICAESELTLGRLVLRRLEVQNGKTILAFSTVDSRIPVDGVLRRYLDTSVDSSKGAYDFELNPTKFSVRSFLESNRTNIDLFAQPQQFEIFYREWIESPKFQYGNIRTASKGERVKLRQRRKGSRNDFLVVASNDYLGLATAPEVMEAAKKAIDDYGFGSTGSPLATGLTDIHEELCSFLATIFHKEKVILFNSGYAANVGVIPSLTGAQDLIVSDILSHASILDGLQMSKATARFFKHNNPTHLEKILKENRDEHMAALIITEGVFSMDGDVPPLPEIMEMSRKYNARLMVDEAHSFGVLGATGRGTTEKFPTVKPDIIMGTFSKICGGIGGFIASDHEVIHWLNFYARSLMFSVSIPPSTAAAALAALKLFVAKPQLVKQLHSNIAHFVAGLRDLGFNINPNHESAVIPVVVGDEEKMGIMNQIFWQNGIYVVPIAYPVVGRNQARFRFTIMATHTVSDLDYVLNVLDRAMEKVGFSPAEVAASKREVVDAA